MRKGLKLLVIGSLGKDELAESDRKVEFHPHSNTPIDMKTRHFQFLVLVTSKNNAPINILSDRGYADTKLLKMGSKYYLPVAWALHPTINNDVGPVDVRAATSASGDDLADLAVRLGARMNMDAGAVWVEIHKEKLLELEVARIYNPVCRVVVADLVFLKRPCGLPEMIHPADARHPIRLGLRRGNKLLVGGEGRKASTLPDGVDSLADFGIHVAAKTDIGKQKQKCDQ